MFFLVKKNLDRLKGNDTHEQSKETTESAKEVMVEMAAHSSEL